MYSRRVAACEEPRGESATARLVLDTDKPEPGQTRVRQQSHRIVLLR